MPQETWLLGYSRDHPSSFFVFHTLSFSPALQAGSLPTELSGKPLQYSHEQTVDKIASKELLGEVGRPPVGHGGDSDPHLND